MGKLNIFERHQLRHTLAEQDRARQFSQYKANREAENLSISREGIFGSQVQENYKKQTVDFPDRQESLDIITNQNINRDTTILWHTRGKSIQHALRCGQLKPQALTAKAIKVLGGYHKKCLDRKIKSRIESKLHLEKEAIINKAQTEIEQLQQLERLLGHRIYDVSTTFKEITAALGALEGGKTLKEDLSKHQKDTAWLQAAGYDKMLLLIKTRIIDILRQAQAENQQLTHSQGAYLRGDLNSFIEDAVKVTRDHVQDLHNPVTRDHQLAYGADEALTIDSDYHTDGSLEELEDLLLVVSDIGKQNDDALEKLKGPVTPTRATKWQHWRSFYDAGNPYRFSLFDSAEHFFGTIWNYLLDPFNLIETMLLGHRAGWIASFQYEPKGKDLAGATNYYALIARVKEHTRLSTKIGLTLHKVFSYLFWEGLIKGFYDGIKQLSRLPIDVMTDFQRQETQWSVLLEALNQELDSIKEEEKKIAHVLGIKDKPENDSRIAYAQAALPLIPYHSHGVLNSSADGFIGFVDLFGHHMFAKHPFTAVVSTAGAAASFLAFFAEPLAVSLMGQGYTTFLLDQGYLWTKDPISASLTGSFTHFKLIGAAVEGVEHGPDSWLSKGVSYAVKDPAATITYTTLSWAMGHAIVNFIEIPGLSAELRAHIGNPPALSEIFGGAKLGVIGYHLLASPHQSSETDETGDVSKQIEEAIQAVEQLSAQEKNRQALLGMLHDNQQWLAYLSPVLKAKLQHQLPQLISHPADASAVEKLLDPDKHAQSSTLRSVIGRIISYIPALIRCLLSPLAVLYTRSLLSAVRPWKELAVMMLDDVTSTVHAFFHFTHKILEMIFNRLPRTLADVVVNGMIARVASFFGYHQVTTAGYKLSAAWDIAQEKLYSNTTGALLTLLARANTTPHPEVGLRNGLNTGIYRCDLFKKNRGASDAPAPASVIEALKP